MTKRTLSNEFMQNIATEEAWKNLAYGSFCRIKLRSRYSIAQIAG